MIDPTNLPAEHKAREIFLQNLAIAADSALVRLSTDPSKNLLGRLDQDDEAMKRVRDMLAPHGLVADLLAESKLYRIMSPGMSGAFTKLSMDPSSPVATVRCVFDVMLFTGRDVSLLGSQVIAGHRVPGCDATVLLHSISLEHAEIADLLTHGILPFRIANLRSIDVIPAGLICHCADVAKQAKP
jgi:hypothetical protein